ncbi:hypothetical protein EDD21DRAFT_350782 [Dissophora ornata]|nr:hypothetical protein EDD21DRAFT_350782 [Dissophora ornata]
MLSNPLSPWRSVLTPQGALDLANAHLENARRAKIYEKALPFCKDAETAISRIRRSVKKDLMLSSHTEDQTLRNKIAGIYFEIGELMGSLGYHSKAKIRYQKAEDWG